MTPQRLHAYNQLAEISQKLPKVLLRVVFISPGWFRDNVKYAFIKALTKLEAVWLTHDAEEYKAMKDAGLPVRLWKESPDDIDFLLRTRIAVYSTHHRADGATLIPNACLKGAMKVQLWHGIPAKTVGYLDAIRSNNPYSQTAEELAPFLNDCCSYDHIVTESSAAYVGYRASDEYKSFPGARIHMFGSSRLDYLTHNSQYKLDDPTTFYHVGMSDSFYEVQAFARDRPHVEIILYAPTYREGSQQIISDSVQQLITALNNSELQRNYILVVKLHPAVILDSELEILPDLITVNPRDDIMPYLLLANTLITDYSSVWFDFAIQGKNTVFFQPDQQAYRETRDLQCYGNAMMPLIEGYTAHTAEQAVEYVCQPDEASNQWLTRKASTLHTFGSQQADNSSKVVFLLTSLALAS